MNGHFAQMASCIMAKPKKSLWPSERVIG